MCLPALAAVVTMSTRLNGSVHTQTASTSGSRSRTWCAFTVSSTASCGCARSARWPDRGVRYLATRFSAKEAFSKAIGLGMRMPMTWRLCEIGKLSSGKPVIAWGSAFDQRRYYLPCPHCKEPIKLLWSQVTWDDARTEDGRPDLAKVRASAHYVCQLCLGKVTDAHKVAALRHGQWRPENPNAMPGVRSYHLSSLYSPDRKCTWGHLAVAFIEGVSTMPCSGSLAGGVSGPSLPWYTA